MLQRELNIRQRNKNKMTAEEKKYQKRKEEKKNDIQKKEESKKEEKSLEKEEEHNKNEKKKNDNATKKEKPGAEKRKRKTRAVISVRDIPISTKQSVAICKFIRGKKIQDAISDLEQVMVMKKAVPMKGEIPHKKGRGIASGRFPKKAAEKFIKLLKSASANATYNDIENPVIIESIANIGSRPWGKFGQVRRKRTHIKIIAGTKQNKKVKSKK